MGVLFTGSSERELKGALEMEHLSLSLYGCSVRGTWRRDFITGDPGRYVEKALAKGISFHRGSAGEPERVFIYQTLRDG